MLSDDFQSSFSGEVPLFPLPNVVFFPGTRLPLHIFEERYQTMLHDVRKGERLIAIALIDEGVSRGAKVPIRPIAGLGRLTRVEKLPNGLFNISLFGLSRVQIQEELESAKPYRVAKVNPLPDNSAGLAREEADEMLDRAFKAFNRVLRKYSRFPGEFLTRFKELPIGVLLDIIAHHLPCDARKKQPILEEQDAQKRCQKIVELLDKIFEGPDPSRRVSALSLFPQPSEN